MRALNITIRCAVHEALDQAGIARNATAPWHRLKLRAGERAALDFCEFQLATVHDYMEPPSSPEAYKLYVSEPDVSNGRRTFDRGCHGEGAHGAWPAGNGAAWPCVNSPCRPGGRLAGDGSRASQ